MIDFLKTSYVYNQVMSILLSNKSLLELLNEMINQIISFLPKHPIANLLFYHIYYSEEEDGIPFYQEYFNESRDFKLYNTIIIIVR